VARRSPYPPGYLGTLVVFLGIAGLGLLNPLLHHRANLRAKDWPETTGELVRFERHRYEGMRGELCELRLRYRYSVGGREYSGRRLWFGGQTGCLEPHVPEFHAGQRVAVAYHPRRPVFAVLVRSHPLHRSDFVLAAVCALPGLVVLLIGLVKYRWPPSESAPPSQARPPAAGTGGGTA
jgi:hypothetical protein